ncbi:hypothetical protein ATO8_15097 [Roseivivax marinus]|jgi:hypothetical protein|uniref:Phasin domain-containing protein n=1 Tax=Roseivivax marinus TaxID=1379903 RepID=W4HH28_9RHOB|nr:phasin family protein [Roseivivax marinus]ETW12004.1 hypothetical protein ATO8_15097 [Roseivivax marinus]UMA64090.1 phasin family protein [Roseivivax marinus]SEK33872.1 Phasin protein [Roseivivax marinus]
MTKQTQNFDTILRDAMNAFPVNTEAFEDTFKRNAELTEKLSDIVTDAAGRSTELSTDFTRKTLERMGDLTKSKSEPADYAQGVADFSSAQAQAAFDMMNSFAEIAKETQKATVDAMMDAGRAHGTQAAQTAKKTTQRATKTANDAAKATASAA